MDPETTVRDFMNQFPHDSVTVGSPHLGLVLDGTSDGKRRAALIALACLALVLLTSAAVYFFPNP
jgi:hypothetical protein